jgi:phosphatidate cytidylyltransferase
LASQLGQRLIAAVLLMAVTLGALWLGAPFWGAFVALGAAAMSWEWARLVGRGAVEFAGYLAIACVSALAGYLGFEGNLALALVLLLLAAVLVVLAAVRAVWQERLWRGAGVLYVGLPSLALIWLRGNPGWGLATCLWLLALVWAIDSAAYFAGRAIGGPKLAPRISPRKTWAGLVGGCAAAALVSALAAAWAGANVAALAALGVGLAFVEQGGDLAESAVKRHFGVKDSSELIPGHGGMLDRVDGLVAVATAIAAFALLVGESPLAGS